MGDDLTAVRHKLADAVRDAEWHEAKEIISRHPALVDSARPGGRSGFAPIHQAAFYGNLDFIQFLLDANADVRLCTADGHTAKMIAKQHSRPAAVEALEKAEKTTAVAADDKSSKTVSEAERNSKLARHWLKVIDSSKGKVDQIWEEISEHPEAVNVIPPEEKLTTEIASIDDCDITTTDPHSFPRRIEVVYRRGKGNALMLDGREVEDGTEFWCGSQKGSYNKLTLYDTAENAAEMGEDGKREVSGGEGATLQTKVEIHASYAIIHQVAFYGHRESLRGLATLPECDLSLRSIHGESIMDIAGHKMQKSLARCAREVIEEQFAKSTDVKQRQRLVDTLTPLPCVPMRGLLSNVPEKDGYFPARPLLAVDWMAECRKSAHLKDCKGLDEDWLLARLPLHDDPVLQEVVTYFTAALPTHRGPVEALSNFVQGGALLGLSAFPAIAKKYEEFKSEDDIMQVVRSALYDLSDRIDALTRSHDVSARDHRKILGEYCENKLTASLLMEDEIQSASGLDRGTYNEKAGENKKALFEKCEGGATGLSRILFALFNQLDREIEQLKRRIVEFINVCEKGVGIGAGTDLCMGTNNHIFAMLGSNCGPGGGWDYGPVAFALKKTILFHPDCEMTPQATTEYAGERRMEQIRVRRPWIAAGSFPDGGAAPVDQLPTEEKCGWGWTEGFSQVTCDSLRGDPSFSVYQSFYARKRNQLHGYLSLGFEEAIAREVVAGARCVLTGVRDNFSGRRGPGGQWIGREPGPRAAGISPLSINGEWHCLEKLVVGGRDVEVGNLRPEECTFDVIVEFYNQTEGHGRVEVHLPRCITREAIEHIFLTNEVLTKLKEGTPEMQNTFKQIKDGLLLPDGREINISNNASAPWTSESPSTLTVCNTMEEFVLAQERFYRKRYDLLRSCKDVPAEEWNLEQFSLNYGQQHRRGMTFRTGSFLLHTADWLPRIDGDEYRRGFAVSFECNSVTGILIQFAATPCPGEDAGEDAKKDAFPKYALAIGCNHNGMTRVGKLWPESREIVMRDNAHHRCDPTTLAAAATGGDARWQRYWAAVSYEGSRAFVLFGWVPQGELCPPDVVALKAVTGHGLRNEEFLPAERHGVLSRPVFSDGSPGAPPIENVRYVGFATHKVPITIRGLHIHRAPRVQMP